MPIIPISVILLTILGLLLLVYVLGYKYCAYLQGYSDSDISMHRKPSALLNCAWPLFIWFIYADANPHNLNMDKFRALGSYNKGKNKAICDKQRGAKN